ncbi:ABC transporter permease [Gammaproteobacteria bacterium]|jgi:lipoprotein-releasing system permease protein|nr:ABC transporter permease [Gammaproteobacteria bacterium]
MNLLVAYRFLFSKYNLSFISIISKISIIGLMLGVGILITVLSVMNGFEKELREKILGFTSHVNVYPHNQYTIEELKLILKANKNISAYSVINRNEDLISSDSVNNYPIILHSVNSEDEKLTSNISKMMYVGTFNLKEPSNIIIGNVLANNLKVTIGDEITITNYKEVYKSNKYIISGIFDSGINEYNQRFVYGSNINLYNTNEFSYVKLKLIDPLQASYVSSQLFNSYSLITSNWTETHNALFQAINNEKRVMFIILALIIAIASFNIISSLTLLVMNKQKDIAILISLGINKRTIESIFLIQGFIIGVVGISLGVLLGLTLSININSIVLFVESLFSVTLISPDVYHLDEVPYIILISDIYKIIVMTFIMVLLSSIYPAQKASKLIPAQSLNS